MVKVKRTYWVADTESTVPPDRLAYGDESDIRSIEIPDDTHVWATSMAAVDGDDVFVDSDLDGFFNRLMRMGGVQILYFHNLSWDAYFLLAWLAGVGYEIRDNREVDEQAQWTVGRGEVVILCNGQGSFYSIKFRLGKTLVECRDSLKLLPFSVDMIAKSFGTRHQKLKGTVDYGKDRPVGYVMDDTECAYVRNDVLVVAEALRMLDDITPEWRDSLTIGSMCMREYINTYKGGTRQARRDSYRLRFPELDPETDDWFRSAYYGGWCYVNPEYQDRILGSGHVYDVNSLYPSVMYGHTYPCGYPHDTDMTLPQLLRTDTPFYVRFQADFSLREGRFPFLQQGKHIFGEKTHITESDGVMELTLCRPDFELFEECYEWSYLNVEEIKTFDAVDRPFDVYIDKWYQAKQQAGRDGNKALRQFAKLMLNNLYGKFAQSPIGHTKRFFVEDGYVCSEEYKDQRTGGYIPLGAYITAYARGVTVRAANANHDIFAYSDTDSIHLLGKAEGIEVDAYKLGAWDNESDFSQARFVRQKTYIEIDATTGDPLIRAAGCPQECKTRMAYRVTTIKADGSAHFNPLEYEGDRIVSERRTMAEMLDRYTYGLVETGKKRRVRVRGGVILVPTTFRISRVGVSRR